jgi:hypothetical protein
MVATSFYAFKECYEKEKMEWPIKSLDFIKALFLLTTV